MKYWFQGQIIGQFVGRPSTPAASRVHAGEHYSLEIYRAVVSDIEIVARVDSAPLPAQRMENEIAEKPSSSPPDDGEDSTEEHQEPEVTRTYHHDFDGEALKQSLIKEVEFRNALGPGRTVRGSARDTIISDVTFTDPARHDGKTYGQVRGSISGWFAPPSPSEPEVIPPEREAGLVWRSEEISPRPPSSAAPRSSAPHSFAPQSPDSRFVDPRLSKADEGPGEGSSFSSEKSKIDDEGAPPTLEPESPTSYAESDWPFFTLGHLATLGLMVLSVTGGLLFYFSYLPALGLRRWLYGTVPDGWFTRVIALFLVAGDLTLSALLSAHWQEVGCKSLGTLPLVSLLFGVYVSSLLPRSHNFALCLLALAAALGHFHGPFGTFCR